MENKFLRNPFIYMMKLKNCLKIQCMSLLTKILSLSLCLLILLLLNMRWLSLAWLIVQIIETFCSKQWSLLSINTQKYLNILIITMFPWVSQQCIMLIMLLPCMDNARCITMLCYFALIIIPNVQNILTFLTVMKITNTIQTVSTLFTMWA